MQLTQTRTAAFAASHSAGRWLVPGLVAGAGFLLFEMLAGSFTTSLWSFPEAIAQTIGIGTPSTAFEPTPFVIGIVMHLAFSVGLGALYVALAERFRLCGRRLVVGAVLFMWAESAVSIWVVLHTLFPDTLPILLGAVPFWASFVGRTGFGLILAFVLAPRMARSAITPVSIGHTDPV